MEQKQREPAVKPRLAPAPVAGAASATGAEAKALGKNRQKKYFDLSI